MGSRGRQPTSLVAGMLPTKLAALDFSYIFFMTNPILKQKITRYLLPDDKRNSAFVNSDEDILHQTSLTLSSQKFFLEQLKKELGDSRKHFFWTKETGKTIRLHCLNQINWLSHQYSILDSFSTDTWKRFLARPCKIDSLYIQPDRTHSTNFVETLLQSRNIVNNRKVELAKVYGLYQKLDDINSFTVFKTKISSEKTKIFQQMENILDFHVQFAYACQKHQGREASCSFKVFKVQEKNDLLVSKPVNNCTDKMSKDELQGVRFQLR